MPNGRVVEFQRYVPDPKPAKALLLHPDVRLSVQRSIRKLPILGNRNPRAALLIERSIDDYMPPSSSPPPPSNDGGDGCPESTEALIARGIRAFEAEEAHRKQQAKWAADAERQRTMQRYQCIMDTLRDLGEDLSDPFAHAR